MSSPPHRPLEGYLRRPAEEMQARARAFRELISRRRTVRTFAPDPIPEGVLEDCIRAAGSAPSGANQQPWHFAVVRSAETKRKIREAAEAEERAFYQQRAPDEWLQALAPLGTDEHKPFLETAPALIAIFGERFGEDAEGNKIKHYYVDESVGIATGMLITALHQAGLATLTHTPSPMRFLGEILERPTRERAFLLLVVGFPIQGTRVPDISRKPLERIASWH